MAAANRIAKFAAVWVKLHPRQPLEDSIHGLQTGGVDECELTVSDLRSLLGSAAALHKEMKHLIQLMEPLEQEGRFNIPGLATLNAARAAVRLYEEEAAYHLPPLKAGDRVRVITAGWKRGAEGVVEATTVEEQKEEILLGHRDKVQVALSPTSLLGYFLREELELLPPAAVVDGLRVLRAVATIIKEMGCCGGHLGVAVEAGLGASVEAATRARAQLNLLVEGGYLTKSKHPDDLVPYWHIAPRGQALLEA